MRSYYVLLLVVTVFLLGCTKDIQEPCTISVSNCTVCQECPKIRERVCPSCPSIPEPKKCPDTNDEIIIIRGENHYGRGLELQHKANQSLEDLDHYMFYKEYANCSRILTETIYDLETANAFYQLATKQFKTLGNVLVAVAYHNSTQAYIDRNNDYIQYLLVHRTYCNLHEAEEGYSNVDYMKRNGERWLNRSDIHWQDHIYYSRIVEELRT